MATGHHRRINSMLCVLAALSISAGACGGTTATPPGHEVQSPSATQEGTLTVSGQARTYLLFRPPSLDADQPAPVVLALHGFTSNAVGMETMTLLDAQAVKSGFVVVYPEGLARSWNAGRCCGDAQSKDIDDVAFISQLIDSLAKDARIDPKRVFVTGMSNGGMMAHRLACEISDRIAAVASVSGGLMVDACHPTRSISILEMHGTADPLVRLDQQLTDGMRQWASLDGCAPTPKVSQDGDIATTMWTPCREGVTVMLQAVVGAGHSWFAPNAPARPGATGVVWDFFSHAPSRAATTN